MNILMYNYVTKKLLVWELIVIVALIIFLSSCSTSSQAAQVDPTSEPSAATAAAKPTSTPEPTPSPPPPTPPHTVQQTPLFPPQLRHQTWVPLQPRQPLKSKLKNWLR